VSLPVVRRFVKKVEEAALGERVVRGLAPDQKLVQVGAGLLLLLHLALITIACLLFGGLLVKGRTLAAVTLPHIHYKQACSVQRAARCCGVVFTSCSISMLGPGCV
jgi:signal recognition particle GTPase